jgi:SAM-dependent methyltransferase
MKLFLAGRILDLGSGAKRPSYHNHIKVGEKTEIVSIDISPQNKPSIVADISEKIPVATASCGAILLINTIHLIKNPQQLLKECYRTLQPGGTFVANFPLIWSVGNEPVDYWRFTDNGVCLLLNRAGFIKRTVVPYGGHISSVLSIIDNYLPVFFRIFLHPAADLFDRFFTKIVRQYYPCPIGFLVVASKSSVKSSESKVPSEKESKSSAQNSGSNHPRQAEGNS